MVRGRRSRVRGHEADVYSLDRDSDICGIRALNSCRARHCNLFRQRQRKPMGVRRRREANPDDFGPRHHYAFVDRMD
jgi:hypothetical protein